MQNEIKNKTNIKIIKKIGGLLSMIIISVSVLIGVSFGFVKAVKDAPNADTSYNNKVLITTDVKFDIESDKNIYDAAKYVQDTLEFLGLQNATVSSIGDDTLLITNPIVSYDSDINDDTASMLSRESSDNIPDLIQMMLDPDNNKNYTNEIYNLILPILFNGTIDFRTINGDPIFGLGENDQYKFLPTNMEQEDGSTDGINTNGSVKNFYNKAKVIQVNGSPVIEIQIKEHGNDNSSYINMFKDFNYWISTNTESSGYSSKYIIYFNFDATYNILNKLYPEEVSSKSSVDDYILTHDSLRPLYLASSSSTIMSSKYDDSIQISGNFNDKQAEYFVNKINNGNEIKYNNFSISLSLNERSKVILLVMSILLLLLILTIIFSFVSYFGLLGVITSIGFLLSSLFMFLIVTSIGLAISGLVLGSLMFSLIMSATLFYKATDMYKKNNQDKFISITTRFLDKYKEINKSLFFPTFSLVVIIYVSALMLSTIITLSLYLIAISIVISYLMISLISIPMIYGYDLLLEFSKEVEDKKWSWLEGYNNKFKNNINLEVKGIKQKTLGISLLGIIILILSLIVGGSLYATTGSFANINLYGTKDYVYNVKIIESENNSYDLIGDEYAEIGKAYTDAENILGENTVQKSFEDNGININNIDVIRFDELYSTNEQSSGLWSSFGFQITSTKMINSEEKTSINNSLSNIGIGYELTNEMSMSSENSEKIISYSDNKYVKNAIISLLILTFIVSLISLLVSNWGVSISVLATTLLESVFVVSPIFILFIPYNLLIWFPIFILLAISGALKIMMSQEAKWAETKKDRWIKISKRKMFVIPISALILFIIELILIGSYGFMAILPMLLITIFIPIVIFFVQQFVFPYFSEILGDFRDRIKENKLKDDIRNSKEAKENNESKEEMIEGINM